MTHLTGEQLRGYLGGELAARERQVVEQHLGACAVCRRELSLYRAVDEVVAGASPSPDWVPELLLAEVSRQVRQERRPWWVRRAGLWKAATAVAAFALMFGVALYAENVHYWHDLEQQNRTLYAEHYSFVAAPQAEAVRNVSLVVPR